MFLLLPGGKVINEDLIENTEVQDRVLIIHFRDFSRLPIAYPTSGEAHYAGGLIEAIALLSSNSGAPVITSISPATVVTPSGLTLFNIYGNNFIASASILVQGAGTVATTFVSSGNLQITLNIIGAPGTYFVEYSDSAGGFFHYAAGITLIP